MFSLHIQRLIFLMCKEALRWNVVVWGVGYKMGDRYRGDEQSFSNVFVGEVVTYSSTIILMLQFINREIESIPDSIIL